MIDLIIESALIGGLFAQVNKSMKIDEKAMKKNIRAFTTMAEAENKVAQCQKNAIDKLLICAKRKTGILNGHIRMFQEQFELIRKVEFKPGQGIEEIERFDEISKKMNQSISATAFDNKLEVQTPKTLMSLALYGIGGLMIKDSKLNLEIASRKIAQANMVDAQADSVCIALNGLAKHVEIVTDLLQKLSVMYMKSIKNISEIISKNGTDPDNYSQMDIDAINLSLALTKVIYRIINTPLVDENGEITKESVKVIEEGNDKIRSVLKM